MKDNLFDLLMNFFEESLSQISAESSREESPEAVQNAQHSYAEEEQGWFKAIEPKSMRIFSAYEQCKLTKASYQFIIRMVQSQILDERSMESVLDDLLLSDSRYITLEEMKWTIRSKLSKNLNDGQLAFLDLVLYQKEDKHPQH